MLNFVYALALSCALIVGVLFLAYCRRVFNLSLIFLPFSLVAGMAQLVKFLPFESLKLFYCSFVEAFEFLTRR